MMLENPQLEDLTQRLPNLQRLLERLENDVDFDPDNDVCSANLAHEIGLRGDKPSPKIFANITHERAMIYLALIDLQMGMADAGITRVKALMQMFHFYTRDVLGRDARFAKMDIIQQATEVSLMFVINSSQLAFVKGILGEEDDRVKVAAERIDLQEKALEEFRAVTLKQLDTMAYIDPGEISEEQRFSYITTYEMTTLDVADYNLALANQTSKLLENGLRGRYYWNQYLSHLTGSDGAQQWMPQEDLQCDADIQKMYLERCTILLGRAKKVYELAYAVSQ